MKDNIFHHIYKLLKPIDVRLFANKNIHVLYVNQYNNPHIEHYNYISTLVPGIK